MSLRRYNRKRNLQTTSAPRGASEKGFRNGKSLRSVVQKHAASRLRSDFRLANSEKARETIEGVVPSHTEYVLLGKSYLKSR